MKRFLILGTVAFLHTLFLSGQDSKEIISKVSGIINSIECVEINFSFTAKDGKGELIGEQIGVFISQGDMFMVKAPQIDIYCDGKSKWIYDKDNGEITIIGNDSSVTDITENPFNIFKTFDTVFNFPSKPSDEKDGCRTIIMTPKEKKINYSSVEIVVKMETYMPVSIKYTSKDGQTYFAQIDTITKISPKEKSFFTINIDSYIDVIVTDLR
jgi:outer membrane lipoprotein-sorting protein